MRACVDCLRRAQLLRELTPGLDRPAAGRPPLVLALDLEELAYAVNGPRARRARTLERSDDDLLTGADDDERQLGVESVCVHHADYPRRLHDLADPPAVLHVLGGIRRLRRVLGPALDGPTVGMVGARRPPEDARRTARRIAEAVAGAGITVVSGMAFGIDEASHRGALGAGSPEPADGPAAGGPRPGGTVAVLAAGVERATPATLHELYGRIAADGVVVGELPPGSSPRRWSFPARNRLIAALGDGLVVVAAGRGSGSLRSVEHARTLGRPVGVVPGSILDPRYAGGLDVLRGVDLLGGEDDEDATLTRAIVDPDDVRRMLHADRLRLDLFGADPCILGGDDGPGGRDASAAAAGAGVPGPATGGAADGGVADAVGAGAVAAAADGASTDGTGADGAGADGVRADRAGEERRRTALTTPMPAADPLRGLEGRARTLAQRLLAGPRTIESLIAEADAATVLAGLGELEAGGRLSRSLGGELQLTVERPADG